MAQLVSEWWGTSAGVVAGVSAGVLAVLFLLIVYGYLVARIALGRKQRAVREATAPGPPAAALFPWLGWAFGHMERGGVTLADRTAAAAELNRELEEIPRYDFLVQFSPYLPVIGMALTAATVATVFGEAGELPPGKVPGVMIMSVVFISLAVVTFLLSFDLRRLASRVEAAALRWFDARAAEFACDHRDDVRKVLAGLVQPLARLDVRSDALERAVVTLANAGAKVAAGLDVQQKMLNQLAPLGEELRHLRESNTRVGIAAEKTAEGARQLLTETTDQVRQFGAAVRAFGAGLAALEAGQRGLADAQTGLTDLLEKVGDGLGGVLSGMVGVQTGLETQSRELADAGGRLRAAVDQAEEAFRECGTRVQGAADGLAEPVGALARGAEAWRAAVDRLIPAVDMQEKAANAMQDAAGSIAASADRLAGGSDKVAQAAVDLQVGHRQVAAAAGGLAVALQGAGEVLQVVAATGRQLEVVAAALPPAVSRLDQTVESAGQTVERLDGANSRLADGFERRLSAFDQNALRPAVGSLRELDKVCTDLRRDLNFSGVMDDLVAATQALWRAAQDQQDAARSLRSTRQGSRWWPFGRVERSNGQTEHEKETS